MLINVTICAVQTCNVQLKMEKQFALARANSNSFRVMLKMVAFVMHPSAHQTMTAVTEFVAAVNVQLLAEIKTIALMEKIVRITDA